MKTIKCPFDFMKDEQVPLCLVFDILSVGKEEAMVLARVVGWLMGCRDNGARQEAFHILERNLGDYHLHLFIHMFLKTYDGMTHRMTRYHPVESEDTIRDAFYIVDTINRISPELWKVADKEIKQRKQYERNK